ncbi:TetR family transcriptional regulator [Streptomyces uncialis]|uniref:TetR family transcriptional regulator n=1 Tax=Streptomyces uncialis TaxID=1048205 RepID=UPI0033F38879
MKQERAARTRKALVEAAALEFDRHGYEGTSLARVSRTARISLGALTFHFASKAELADTVLTQGFRAARGTAEQVLTREESALRSVVDLTLALTRLLEEDPSVRAAARLVRERTSSAKGRSPVWAPLVEELLVCGRWDGLRPSADPRVVVAMADYLIAGAEEQVRQWAGTTQEGRGRAEGQLAAIWELALRGIQEDPAAHRPEARDLGPPDGPLPPGSPR